MKLKAIKQSFQEFCRKYYQKYNKNKSIPSFEIKMSPKKLTILLPMSDMRIAINC